MKRVELLASRNLLAVVASAVLLANSPGAAAADPPPVAAKSSPAPAAPAKPGNLLSTMADVGDISSELRKLEKHIATIDQSVAEISESVKHIDNSLAPFGALTRPEGLAALMTQASDVAFSRSVMLILIASACAAALLVLLAFLLRWSLNPVSNKSK